MPANGSSNVTSPDSGQSFFPIVFGIIIIICIVSLLILMTIYFYRMKHKKKSKTSNNNGRGNSLSRGSTGRSRRSNRTLKTRHSATKMSCHFPHSYESNSRKHTIAGNDHEKCKTVKHSSSTTNNGIKRNHSKLKEVPKVTTINASNSRSKTKVYDLNKSALKISQQLDSFDSRAYHTQLNLPDHKKQSFHYDSLRRAISPNPKHKK